MNKVYVVTRGDYSDYHVESIFSTREAAEKYCALNWDRYGDYPNIEEYIKNDIDITREVAMLAKAKLNNLFGIQANTIAKVIFNDPATIVIWKDGNKTIVKSGVGDKYDPEKGLAMAIAKKYLGNKGNYYEVFKKWLPKEKKESEE